MSVSDLTRIRRAARRAVTALAQREADRWASGVGVPLEQRAGGVHDAFTHAYVSARLTLRLGAELARRLGDLNEWLGSLAVGRKLEARMDQHNNAIGRRIGVEQMERRQTSKTETAGRVRDALDRGELRVIQPGDPPRLTPSRAPAPEPGEQTEPA